MVHHRRAVGAARAVARRVPRTPRRANPGPTGLDRGRIGLLLTRVGTAMHRPGSSVSSCLCTSRCSCTATLRSWRAPRPRPPPASYRLVPRPPRKRPRNSPPSSPPSPPSPPSPSPPPPPSSSRPPSRWQSQIQRLSHDQRHKDQCEQLRTLQQPSQLPGHALAQAYLGARVTMLLSSETFEALIAFLIKVGLPPTPNPTPDPYPSPHPNPNPYP